MQKNIDYLDHSFSYSNIFGSFPSIQFVGASARRFVHMLHRQFCFVPGDNRCRSFQPFLIFDPDLQQERFPGFGTLYDRTYF